MLEARGFLASLTAGDWIAIVGVLIGSGALWEVVKLYRARARFRYYTPPEIDQANRVHIAIVQKGQEPGYITYLDVVSVRTGVYAALFRILNGGTRVRGGISVLESALVVEAGKRLLAQNEPAIFDGGAVESLLPIPWRPWASMRLRSGGRRELRVKAKWGTKAASYTRLRFQPNAAEDPTAPPGESAL
jgi:hypothetical protein